MPNRPQIVPASQVDSEMAPDFSSVRYRMLAQGDSWFSINGLNLFRASSLLPHLDFGHSAIIVVQEAITGGAGTLTESIFGGQRTYALELTSGKQHHPLKKHELVHVQGTQQNGQKFVIATALATVSAKEPWEFTGKSGSTGP